MSTRDDLTLPSISGTVTIAAEDGRPLLTIYPDGSVIGAVEDASEAARRFVEALRLEVRPPARVITTREELDEVVETAMDDGHWLVVVSERRPWIIIEDEDGNEWAWSWWEEDEPQSYKPADLLHLPATVLWEGDA